MYSVIVLCFSSVCINNWLLDNSSTINFVAYQEMHLSYPFIWVRNLDVACLVLQLQSLCPGCIPGACGGWGYNWGSLGEGVPWLLAAYCPLRLLEWRCELCWLPPEATLTANHMGLSTWQFKVYQNQHGRVWVESLTEAWKLESYHCNHRSDIHHLSRSQPNSSKEITQGHGHWKQE